MASFFRASIAFLATIQILSPALAMAKIENSNQLGQALRQRFPTTDPAQRTAFLQFLSQFSSEERKALIDRSIATSEALAAKFAQQNQIYEVAESDLTDHVDHATISLLVVIGAGFLNLDHHSWIDRQRQAGVTGLRSAVPRVLAASTSLLAVAGTLYGLHEARELVMTRREVIAHKQELETIRRALRSEHELLKLAQEYYAISQ